MSKQTEPAADIEQAKREAAAARARVDTTVGALKYKLNPRTIAAGALDNVRGKTDEITDRATEAAHQRPAAAGAAVGAVALFLFRKPVVRTVKWMFRRKPMKDKADRASENRNDTVKAFERTRASPTASIAPALPHGSTALSTQTPPLAPQQYAASSFQAQSPAAAHQE